MRREIPPLKLAELDNENGQCIKKKKKVINSSSNDSHVNKGYLTAPCCICELCIKDVIEQTYNLLLFYKNDYEVGYFIGLLKRHNVETLITELNNASDGEYHFPPIPTQINSKDLMNILYSPTVVNIDKNELLQTVNAYVNCRNEFLEDYNNRVYKLKIKSD